MPKACKMHKHAHTCAALEAGAIFRGQTEEYHYFSFETIEDLALLLREHVASRQFDAIVALERGVNYLATVRVEKRRLRDSLVDSRRTAACDLRAHLRASGLEDAGKKPRGAARDEICEQRTRVSSAYRKRRRGCQSCSIGLGQRASQGRCRAAQRDSIDCKE